MKPLRRGWLPLCLATGLLFAAVQPASAQRAVGQPGGNNFGQPGGNNFGQPGGVNFGQPGGNNFGQPAPFGQPNNPAAAAVSSAGTGMMIAGIGMILAGLALTGGVVYLAIQGQNTGYGGGGRRRKKPRRDDDD